MRSANSIDQARAILEPLASAYRHQVIAAGESRRSIDRLFLVRDALTTTAVYLTAMAGYIGPWRQVPGLGSRHIPDASTPAGRTN